MTDSLSQVLPGFGPSDPGSTDPDGQRRSFRGRRGEGRDRKRKRKKRRRSIVVLLVALLLVAAAIGGAYVGLQPLVHKLTEPDDFTGAGTTAVSVKVPEGASGQKIGSVLTTAGVVKTQQAFLDAYNANARARQIQPGTYALKRQMSSAGALALLLDPASRRTKTLNFPEGIRADEVYTKLARELKLSRATMRRLGVSKSIGLPKAAGGNAEGWLFPATYDFQPDVTEAQALRMMVARAKQAYAAEGVSAKLLREVSIKASIIQAEAGNQKYMGPISRVLTNRLRTGTKLQLDSTVSYATQKFGVTTTPAQRNSASRYNTYRYAGLPVGPISNPGQEAIHAALHPTPGRWFFFVTVNPTTGETKFAVDATTHAKYVREFQAWLAKN